MGMSLRKLWATIQNLNCVNRLKIVLWRVARAVNPVSGAEEKPNLLLWNTKKRAAAILAIKTKKQKSLSKWQKESWQTRSGKPSTQGPKATGERYLPKAAIKSLTPQEYAATTRAKREGTRQGKQFVRQPKSIAKKTAKKR
jgi:hypothetical protein